MTKRPLTSLILISFAMPLIGMASAAFAQSVADAGKAAEECQTIACLSARITPKHPLKKPQNKTQPQASNRVSTQSVTAAAEPDTDDITSPEAESTRQAVQESLTALRSEANAPPAQRAETPSSSEAGTTCTTIACLSRANTPARDVISELVHSAAVLKEMSNRRAYQGGRCDAFATNNKLNDYGKLTLATLHKPQMKYLYQGTSDIHRLCPNYRNMSKAQKDGMWIIFVTGFSMQEASCQPQVPNHGAPNGTAYGLFQLHLGRENYLTPKTGVCKKYDSKTVKGSLECALGGLNEQAMQGQPIFRRFHWAVLDPNDRDEKGRLTYKAQKIQNSIRSYRYCQVRNNAGVKVANR